MYIAKKLLKDSRFAELSCSGQMAFLVLAVAAASDGIVEIGSPSGYGELKALWGRCTDHGITFERIAELLQELRDAGLVRTFEGVGQDRRRGIRRYAAVMRVFGISWEERLSLKALCNNGVE